MSFTSYSFTSEQFFERIKQFFPQEGETLWNLFQLIYQENLYLTLVGGGPRDYLLYGKVSSDLDFEIRSKKTLSESEWILALDHLKRTLKLNFSLQELPYQIFRLHLYPALEVEISSPRLEFFKADGESSHHNFVAHLSGNLLPEEAGIRRDFTINAIGLIIEMDADGKNWHLKIADPFNGLTALKEKKLIAVGPDFGLDPVRFLRAFRFSMAHDLNFSEELISQLQNMKLESLSSYYLLSEGLKARHFFIFYQKIFNFIAEHQLTSNGALQALEVVNRVERFKERKLDYIEDIIFILTDNCLAGDIEYQELIDVATLFNFSRNKLYKISNLLGLLFQWNDDLFLSSVNAFMTSLMEKDISELEKFPNISDMESSEASLLEKILDLWRMEKRFLEGWQTLNFYHDYLTTWLPAVQNTWSPIRKALEHNLPLEWEKNEKLTAISRVLLKLHLSGKIDNSRF